MDSRKKTNIEPGARTIANSGRAQRLTRIGRAPRHPKGPKTFVSPTSEAVAQEFENLQSNSGWRLIDFQQLFGRIRKDRYAWPAFEKLTGRGYRPDHLLMSLGHTFVNNTRFWDEWDAWKRKWEGLTSIAKTLRLLEKKMDGDLAGQSRGPIPLPTRVGTEAGSEEYQKSQLSASRLRVIHENLKIAASEIEEYCRLRREWLRRVPRRDIAEKESLGLLMRSVKERTHKWYFTDVSKLLSIDVSKLTVISNNKPTLLKPLRTSAEALRKIVTLRTPLLDRHDSQKVV